MLVVTALPAEASAVTSALADRGLQKATDGTRLEVGSYRSSSDSWEIAVVETGSGNTMAALATRSAIDFFKPDRVFFVGVAGGLKDVRVGDVVFASKVYCYEGGKETATEHLSRPTVHPSSFALTQGARALARREAWTDFRRPHALVAPIVAGEKLLASTKSATAERLSVQFSDAVAVEMEGSGFMEACFTAALLSAGVIRGISDVLDDRAARNQAETQEIAAANAADFLFALLLLIDDTEPLPVIDDAESFPDLPPPETASSEAVSRPRPAGDPTPRFSEMVSGPWAAVSSDRWLRLLEVSNGLLRLYQPRQRDIVLHSIEMAATKVVATAEGAGLVGIRDGAISVSTLGLGGDACRRAGTTQIPEEGWTLLAATCVGDVLRVVGSSDQGTMAFRISRDGTPFAFERLEQMPSRAFVELPEGTLRVDGQGRLLLAGWIPQEGRGLPADGWAAFDRAVGAGHTVVAGIRTVGTRSTVHVIAFDGTGWVSTSIPFDEVVGTVHVARPNCDSGPPSMILVQTGRWVSGWSLEDLGISGNPPPRDMVPDTRQP